MRRALALLLVLGCGASRPAVSEAPVVAEDASVSVAPDPNPDDDDVVGEADACPCDAEDADGWQDDDGCPDPDNDGDQIADVCDLCPNEAEIYQGSCDEDGCPDRSHVCVSETRIQIVEYVHFTRGSARIAPSAMPLLDTVAAALEANPQITLVALVGEAELREPRREALALGRARAVLAELIRRGVVPERLVAEADLAPTPPTDEPGAHRRVRFDVREAIGGGDSDDGGCRSMSPCVVPVCDPPAPTPPAC